MNKLACLLLFPFACTQPLVPGAAPAVARPPGLVVRPTAPATARAGLPAGRNPARTRPVAIRALGRLLRAYTEPARPAAVAGANSSAPLPTFFSQPA